MDQGVNRQILLVEKPSGKLASQHFNLREGTIPELRAMARPCSRQADDQGVINEAPAIHSPGN